MILILSKEDNELSTHEVFTWIKYLGGNCIRLNGEDFEQFGNLNLQVNNNLIDLTIGDPGINAATLDEINVVWYRRWNDFVFARSIREFPGLPTDFRLKISSSLIGEVTSVGSFFFNLLKEKEWLTPPGTNSVNKLSVLRSAVKHGLNIPSTLIATTKKELIRFLEKHNRIITKAIGDFPFIYLEKGNTLSFATKEITMEEIDTFPETFFPTLFQELIEKEIEIRVFYFDEQFYPMAIFSQLDAQTSIDFRHYNFEKPNRNVPYRLPAKIEACLHALMKSLNLQTGSIDLIKTRDGEYVFLEVNPVGQFGMVSYPCNYQLERIIAEYLIKKDRNYVAAC